MDLTLYWFMFPVSIGVATCAMLSGIGGAALFTPIFILGFPLLGPEYILRSTLATQLIKAGGWMQEGRVLGEQASTRRREGLNHPDVYSQLCT